ncbi:MAG: hypothetical protein J7647_17500 [Cyanobacteria bacterium SBLK]|nr:hypothetical protein [Cyanobacteria bacterium SBLK]
MTTEMTIFVNDPEFPFENFRNNENVKILRRFLGEKILNTKNLFIFTSATALFTAFSKIDSIMDRATEHGNLRGWLIRSDDPTPIPSQIFARKDYKFSPIIHSDIDITKRIAMSWQANAQEQLIATAIVMNDVLQVYDCALNQWNIPFLDLPALAKIPSKCRTEFEIDEDGSYLYWSCVDLHIDMETLRATVDPKLKDKLEQEKLLRDRLFGRAVATVRKQYKLRQIDIQGLSEKQVRRIEQGKSQKLSSLQKLAEAHQMTVNNYLETVAQTVSKLRTLKTKD